MKYYVRCCDAACRESQRQVPTGPDRCRHPRPRQGFREADRQAAPRRDPHAVRLARHRPGRRDQSRACGARAEARGQDRQDHGADRRTGARAARQHRCVHLVGLRDRALIAVMTFAFARIGAVVAMRVEDYFPKGKRWRVRLHEKGGKRHEMPAHHNLEAYLDAYLEAAKIRDGGKAPLFRSAAGRTGTLTEKPMHRVDAWRMIQRRTTDLGMRVRVGCHTFRANRDHRLS
jgi:integrase